MIDRAYLYWVLLQLICSVPEALRLGLSRLDCSMLPVAQAQRIRSQLRMPDLYSM